MSMTPERIEEIKRLHAAATSGPWASKNESVYSDDLLNPVCQLYGNSEEDFDNAKDNASFIAASVSIIPELLAALEESQQQVKTLKTEKVLLEGELGQAEAYKHFEAERTKEAQSINRQLVEAQQTIDQQQKKIEWFENNHMGFVDGEGKS